MEKPKNYEEAKMIIKNSVNDNVSKNFYKINYLRAGVVSGLVLGVAATLGIIWKSAMVGFSALPLGAVICFPTLLPIIHQKKVDRRIKNDTYFYGKSEETIMRIANNHVEEYNRLEQGRKR